MNSKKAKIFRKWVTLRGLSYKTVKHMYESYDTQMQKEMLAEAMRYLILVKAGVLEPSMPTLPTEEKVGHMLQIAKNKQIEAKTQKKAHDNSI